MIHFYSCAVQLKGLLQTIVGSNELHAKWLNTLSYLENSGARKIAACEHPTLVQEEMLKHAAEEFRHAHYLKRQIKRVFLEPMEDYSLCNLLGGVASVHYLRALDLKASRYLSKNVGLDKNAVKKVAYLLVTYAIELRADELYRIYDTVLRKVGSKITVKSILLEEKEHLQEMKEGINSIASGYIHAQQVCAFEQELYSRWLDAVISAVHHLVL